MLAHALSRPYAEGLRTQLFKLINEPERCHLDEVGRLDTEIGEAFAATALDLLQEAKVAAARVTAIGSHGQTLRHKPHVKRQIVADQVLRTPKSGMRIVDIKPGEGVEL